MRSIEAVPPRRAASRRTPEREAMRAALHTQLEAHSASDAAESRALRDTLRFLATSEDPFDRGTLPGHVTGSAIIARADASAFLLVYHRKLDRWLQPGGHVHEEDVSVFATAMRESAEETGHEVDLTSWGDRILNVDVHQIPASEAEPPHLHYDIRYLFVSTPQVARVAEKEVVAVEWFDEKAIGTLDLDASLLGAIVIARRHLPCILRG